MTVDIPIPKWNESAREYDLRRDLKVLRGPLEWSWDVTNECVGRCLHCFNRSGILTRCELTDAEMISVSKEIAALKPLGVCLCGGEPLLRAGVVTAIIQELDAAGIAVNMVSNGMLLTKQLAVRLSAAHVHTVQISLDGARAQTHEYLRRITGSFDKAITAIKVLRDQGTDVCVSFSPTRASIREWEDVFSLCERLGVSELRIQPLMPLGTCCSSYDEIVPTPVQYSELVEEYKRRSWNPSSPVRLEWGDPVDHLIRFGQFYSMTTYAVHITADGFLMPSLYLPVTLGNVRRHTLSEYWHEGLGAAWNVRLVRELAFRIRSIGDFRRIRPFPFFDAAVDLDLIDRSQADIEHLTDVTLRYVKTAERR